MYFLSIYGNTEVDPVRNFFDTIFYYLGILPFKAYFSILQYGIENPGKIIFAFLALIIIAVLITVFEWVNQRTHSSVLSWFTVTIAASPFVAFLLLIAFIFWGPSEGDKSVQKNEHHEPKESSSPVNSNTPPWVNDVYKLPPGVPNPEALGRNPSGTPIPSQDLPYSSDSRPRGRP